jgi:hypothetical protein
MSITYEYLEEVIGFSICISIRMNYEYLKQVRGCQCLDGRAGVRLTAARLTEAAVFIIININYNIILISILTIVIRCASSRCPSARSCGCYSYEL